VAQRGGGRAHRGTGGDDVVDHDHALPVEARPGDELGAVEAFDAAPAGLGNGRARSRQEAATRHAELSRDVTRHELALIESP
jgi:hypothetical protein